jgi:GT2 family glycosyltransferase
VADTARARVLVAVPVYGMHAHLDACLSSVARLASTTADVDVIVIDDGSPEIAFAAQLEALCAAHKLAHYRSPRNQGIPRTFNLAIRRAQTGGYAHVALVNSDVVVSPRLVDHLLGAVTADVATVTAWSNQASAFSLALDHRDERLADAVNVDRVASWLHDRFGDASLELPTGAGHCMLLTVAAVERVGLMDPVFGRGYCEELDWCQRARLAGLRNVLALGSFVWHRGSATSAAVGLLGPTDTSVPHNEKIIDARYPSFRRDVTAFFARDTFERAKHDALRAITVGAGKETGWVLQASATPRAARRDDLAVARVDPVNASAPVALDWIGLPATTPVLGDDPIRTATDLFGRPPTEVAVLDTGHVAELARLHGEHLGVTAMVQRPYPSRVI